MPDYFGNAGLWVGRFTLSGCHQRVNLTTAVDGSDPSQISILPPQDMWVAGMQFAGPAKAPTDFVGPPVIVKTGQISPSDTSIDQAVNDLTDVELLGVTPGSPTWLVYPHQYAEFSAQDVFFQQDDDHVFFVTPQTYSIVWNWGLLGQTQWGVLHAPVSYYGTSRIPVFGFPTETVNKAIQLRPAAAVAAPAPAAAIGAVEGFKAANLAITAAGFLDWGVDWTPRTPITLHFTDYLYRPFYHPYVCDFIKALNQNGVDGLLKWPHPADPTPHWPTPPSPTPLQLLENDYFQPGYDPQPVVAQPYPSDDVDFDADGAYAQYNWELFFHAPMLIANQLAQNQRFSDAERWYRYILDPTDLYPVPPPGATQAFPYGFWKVKPFYEQTTETSVAELIALVDTNDPAHQAEIESFQQQVAASFATPFKPFAIARLRTTAFQRAAAMDYIQCLIDWGDNLFRQNTRETITQASQLYVRAGQLLGPRPIMVPRAEAAALAYNDLAGKLTADDLSDPLVAIENAMPASAGQLVPQVPLPYAPSPLASALYFCVPPNDQLLAMWDTVDDRLTKIRHCEDIEGQVEQLPLLAPPIPPGLLVQAAAGGLSLSQVLSALTLPPPLYRFSYLYRQALEFAGTVRALGSALQAALEKDDAEALAMLRATQEVSLLQQMRAAIAQRLQEAQAEQIDLQMYRQRVQDRHDWYGSQPYLYPSEAVATTLGLAAAVAKAVGTALHSGAAVAHAFPEIDAGIAGFGASATIKVKEGGTHVGHAGNSAAKVANTIAAMLDGAAHMAADMGRAEARQAANQRETQLSQDELNEIDQVKVPIAGMKATIAQDLLDDHDLKAQNAQNVAQFLQSKFTNQQLYDWMIGQISSVYLQAYNLAYQMAKRVEVCYRRELAMKDASFIQPGYWDNLHQGLLAADGLVYDLHRMQASYLDNNIREYEISRPISLATLDPVALATLKETGTCFITVPESLFDGDYPGHYLRRIKWAGVGVKLSTPTRPPTINCTLTLLKSAVRVDPDPNPQYAELPAGGDGRFDYQVNNRSIVTSSGGTGSAGSPAPDFGMFETTVHYIITDDRYQTFELAGAISTWQIELRQAANGFDFETITDVVLQLQYTARDGGPQLKVGAQGQTPAMPPAAAAMFRAAVDFAPAWAPFIAPTGAAPTMVWSLSQSQFPFAQAAGIVHVSQAILFLKLKDPGAYQNAQPLTLNLAFAPSSGGAGANGAVTLKTVNAPLADTTLLADTADTGPAQNFPLPIAAVPIATGLGKWTFTLQPAAVQALPAALQTTVTPSSGPAYAWLNPAMVEDLGVICFYTVGP